MLLQVFSCVDFVCRAQNVGDTSTLAPQWTPHMTLEVPNFAPFWVLHPNTFGNLCFFRELQMTLKCRNTKLQPISELLHMTLKCRNTKLSPISGLHTRPQNVEIPNFSSYSGYIPMSLCSRIEATTKEQNNRLQFI